MDVQDGQKEQVEQIQENKKFEAQPQGSTHKNFILIGLGIVLILGGAITGGYFLGTKKINEPKACSLEAKICPDGSAVGRTGPNCEFSPCPSSKSKESSNDISTWKTYNNEKYGFHFKYPPTMDVLSENEAPDKNGLQIEFSRDNYDIPRMNLVLYTGSNAQVSQADFNTILSTKKLNDFNYSNISTLKIDGQIFYTYIEDFNYESKKIPPIGGPLSNLKASGIVKKIFFDVSYPYEPDKLKEDQQIFNQILSTFKFTSNTNSSSVPSDWTLKSDTACNVVFPIPPKKAPYYTPDDPKTFSDLAEDGAFWQFRENNEGSSLFAYYKRVLFHNPKAGGSGYIPGLVSVSCSPNESKYTNDILLERYKKTFETASSEIEVSEIKELNLWERKVYAVYVKGGMFDENNPTYLFATDKYIYSVSKIAMSSNSFVKETAETIFNNLNFKD